MRKNKRGYFDRAFTFASVIVGVFVLCIIVIIATEKTNLKSHASASTDPYILAAGDIACGTGSTGPCQQQATSDLVMQYINSSNPPAAILPLGDLQYESGTLADFNTYYDPTWGRFKSISRPAIGNHEYKNTTSDPSDYYTYWSNAGVFVGNKAQGGYYSYDIPNTNWHAIVLDTDCGKINGGKGCIAGSPQETWLKADLTANANKCLLMYGHHPYFSSFTSNGITLSVYPLVKDFYDAHGDLFLTGHVHAYERFSPQMPLYATSTTAPVGQSDPTNGFVEIVVGTGGRQHSSVTQSAVNSVAFNNTDFGVIQLTLHSASYDIQFLPASGGTFTDTSSGNCHNVAAAPNPIPVVSFSGATINPGGTYSTAGSFTDSDSASWSATVDYGDGQGDQLLNLNSDKTFSLSHVYATVGNFTVTVKVTDNDNNTGTLSQAVTVTNPNPQPVTTTILPTADTWVESDKATSNFGKNAAIYVKGSGPVAIGYLKFDLSSFTDMTIKSAKLRIEVAKDGSSLSQNVKQVDNTTWTETGVTYNNRPALSNIIGTISSAGKTLAWQEIDVTPYVQSKVGMLASFGIDMTGTNSIHFDSKESGIAPQLVVTTQ